MSGNDIKYDITMDTDNIHFPQKGHSGESTSFVNEESLLPGTIESRETSGFLPTSVDHDTVQGMEFSPLSEQNGLTQLGLKSKGLDLHYELTHNNQLLIATAGETDVAVFTAYLDQNGAYTFTLHNHLDRAEPAKLFDSNAATNNWQEDINLDTSTVALSQELKTQPFGAYHLSFHHHPAALNPEQIPNDINVYWGDKHIYTLAGDQLAAKSYMFSVEGMADKNLTNLTFTSQGPDNFLEKTIHDISVTSAAQTKLPIELSYCTYDSNGHATEHQFTVNVSTTPPIQISTHEPVDIVFDQAVYQTIIVGNENTHDGSNQTTLNLDHLFKEMAIPAENRLVEIVQREENGSATNVYEVKISDKSQALAPVTVADVQLSFPGGDGGLSVFQRHITIDEGGGGLMPPHDTAFI